MKQVVNYEISQVIIMGAGISGLAAYRTLKMSGIRARVLEKSRGCGGRAATRRENGFVADLGAQFTAISRGDFKELLHMQGESVVAIAGSHGSGRHPRYVHRDGMSALVKSLLVDLDSVSDLLFFSRLQTICYLPGAPDSGPIWELVLESGETLRSEALLFTAPIPQSLEIFKRSGLELAHHDFETLRKIQYSPCFALVVEVDPNNLPSSVLSKLPIWKNPSHASGPWSLAHWDDSDEIVVSELLSELCAILSYCETEHTLQSRVLHRWRFAETSTLLDRDCWELYFLKADCPPLLLAGDAFTRSSVEGAFASEVAAGVRLRELMLDKNYGDQRL